MRDMASNSRTGHDDHVRNVVSKKRVGCGDLWVICGIYVHKSDLIH